MFTSLLFAAQLLNSWEPGVHHRPSSTMGQRSTPFVQIRTVMNWKLLENALKSPLQVRAQSFEEVKMWVGWVIKNDRKCSKTGCSMWDESPRSLFFLFSYSKIQPNEIVNLWNIPKVGDWTAVCRSKTQKKRWKSFPPKSKLLKSSCAKPTQAVANKYLVWYAIMLIIYQKKYHVTVDSMRFWRTRLRRLGHWNLSMLNSGMLDPKNLILALLYKSIPKHQTEDSKYRSAFLVADTCALVRCFF